jgi:oligoribonuclease NrnB/cAMP/cGMP phosphodiesterase (DHH superfamily)
MNPEVNKITRVIYHGDKCPDGKCASWIIWRIFQDRKIPIDGYVHGHIPPDVTGDVIAILDFCFPRETIIKMAKQAKHIYILDHHASTERDLYPKEKPKILSSGAASAAGVVGEKVILRPGKVTSVLHGHAGMPANKIEPLPSNITVILDNNRSGSEITWDWVYPGVPRPWFLEVISDRDLFRWSRPYSKLVSNALFSNGYYTWEKMELLFQQSTTSEAIERLIKDFCTMGSALPDSTKPIDGARSGAFLTEMTTPDGHVYKVKLVQSPKVFRSEVGNKLSQRGCDFAVLYQYDFMLNEWWMSCRASDECMIDMSEVAAQFMRGGGHKKSAGFTIFGSKGDSLQNYFRILTAPPSRTNDLELLKQMGGEKKLYDHVKIMDVSK